MSALIDCITRAARWSKNVYSPLRAPESRAYREYDRRLLGGHGRKAGARTARGDTRVRGGAWKYVPMDDSEL